VRIEGASLVPRMHARDSANIAWNDQRSCSDLVAKTTSAPEACAVRDIEIRPRKTSSPYFAVSLWELVESAGRALFGTCF
jgi:hypothetical protein